MVDPIEATFNACDLDNDGLTIDEIHKSDCLETLEQYGFENLTDTFLIVDENKDSIITKKEGEDAAITMMENFDRKLENQGGCEKKLCSDICLFQCINWESAYVDKNLKDHDRCDMTSTRCHECGFCEMKCSQRYCGDGKGWACNWKWQDAWINCGVNRGIPSGGVRNKKKKVD